MKHAWKVWTESIRSAKIHLDLTYQGKKKNGYIKKTQIEVEIVPWNLNREIIMDLEHGRDEGVTWNDNRRHKQPRTDIDKPYMLKFNKRRNQRMPEKTGKYFVPLSRRGDITIDYKSHEYNACNGPI